MAKMINGSFGAENAFCTTPQMSRGTNAKKTVPKCVARLIRAQKENRANRKRIADLHEVVASYAKYVDDLKYKLAVSEMSLKLAPQAWKGRTKAALLDSWKRMRRDVDVRYDSGYLPWEYVSGAYNAGWSIITDAYSVLYPAESMESEQEEEFGEEESFE